MAGSWSCTLLNWVNCVLNADIDDLFELLDCKVFTEIIKYLDPTHDDQDDHIAIVKNFLKREYPYFKSIDGIPIENVEDIILIASLLLHFSCVKVKDVSIRGTMCQNLEQQDQRAIMQFINCLMKHENITERNLMNSIRASSSEFLDESSTNLSISIPMKNSMALSGSPSISSIVSPLPMSTPNTYRSRKVFQLEAELGAERFDRDFLQEELHRQCVRIEELENLQKSHVGMIHRLQDELLIITENTKDSKADGCSQCRNKDKLYHSQLKSHELEVLRLVSNAVTIEEEKDSLKTKLNEADKIISNWRLQAIESETTLNLLKSQLEDAKSENSRLKITLADKTRYLEEFRQENRIDMSIECDDDTFSIGRMLNSSLQSNPETLSKVIDIQLKEQIDNNKHLTSELDSLKKEVDELAQTLETTRKKLGASEKDKKYTNQQNEQLKSQIKTMTESTTNQIMAYKTQLDEKNYDIKKLTQEIQDLQQSNDNNLAKINNSNKEIVEMGKYINNLIKSHNKVLEDRENHLSDLKQDIVLLNQQKSSLETRLERNKDHINKFVSARNDTIAHLFEKYVNLKRENGSFISKIKSLSVEKDQLSDAIKNKDNMLSEEYGKNNSLSEENKKLELIVADGNTQLKNYKDILNNKEKEINSLERHAEEINNKLLTSEVELKNLHCNYDIVKDRLSKVEQDNTECTHESERLSSKLEKVNVELNSHVLGFELLSNKMTECEDLMVANENKDYISIWNVFKTKLDADKQTIVNISFENETLLEEVTRTKERVSDQDTVIKNLECDNASVKCDLIALKQKLVDNDNDIEELSVKVANFGCEIIEQKTKFDEKVHELEICQNKCKCLMDEIDGSKKVIATQLDLIERYEAELQEKCEEIDNLQTEKSSDEYEIEERVKENNELKTVFEEQKSQLCYQERICAEKSEEIHNLTEKIMTKEDNIKQLNEALSLQEENNSSLRSEIVNLQNELFSDKCKIEDSAKEIAEIKISLEEQIFLLQNQDKMCAENSKEIHNLNESKLSKEKEIKTLEEALILEKSNSSLLKNEVENLQTELLSDKNKFEEHIIELITSVKEYKSELENRGRECFNKNGEILALEEKITMQEKLFILEQSNNSSLKKEISNLEAKQTSDKLKIERFVKEIDELKISIEQHKSQLQNLECACSEKIEDIHALEVKLMSKEVEIKKMEEKNTLLGILEEKLMSKEHEIKDLYNTLILEQSKSLALKNEINDSKMFIDSQSDKINQCKREIDSILNENEYIKKDLFIKNIQIETLLEEVKKSETNLKNQTKLYDDKLSDYESIIEEKTILENTVMEHQIKLKKYEEEQTNYDNELSETKSELISKLEKIDVMSNEIDNQYSQLKDYGKLIDSQQSEIESLKVVIINNESSISSYSQTQQENILKIECKNREIEDIQRDINSKCDRINSMSEEIVSLNSIIKDLESKLDEQKDLLCIKLSQNEALLKDNDDVKDLLAEEVTKRKKAEEEKSNCENECKEELMVRHERIEMLLREMDKMQNLCSERSLTIKQQEETITLQQKENRLLSDEVEDNKRQIAAYLDSFNDTGICLDDSIVSPIRENKSLRTLIGKCQSKLEQQTKNYEEIIAQSKITVEENCRLRDILKEKNDVCKLMDEEIYQYKESMKESLKKESDMVKLFEDIKNLTSKVADKDVELENMQKVNQCLKNMVDAYESQLEAQLNGYKAKVVEIEDASNNLITTHRSKLDEINVTLNTKCDEVMQLSQEVANLKLLLEERNSQIEAHERNVHAQQIENVSLRTELENSKLLIDTHLSALRQCESDIHDDKVRYECLEKDVSIKDNRIEELMLQKLNFKRLYEDSCSMLKEQEANVLNIDEVNKNLNKSLVDRDCKIQVLSKEIIGMKELIDTYEKNIEECKKDIDIKNQECKDLCFEEEQLEDAIAKQALELQVRKHEVDLKSNDVQDLKDAFLKKSSETEILMKELSEIKNMQISIVQTKNVEIKELQALVENLNKNMHQCEEEIISKKSEIERISYDVNNKESQIESLRGEVVSLKQVIEDGKSKLQENIAEMKNVQCYRRDSETKLSSENEQLKEQLKVLNEKLNDVNMRVYTENVRPLVDYDNMLQEKIRLSDELKYHHSELEKLCDENRVLKGAYNALLADNQKLQNKQPDSQETSRLVADLRSEYEEKLTKMKQRMKQLYQEQIAVYSEKQKEELADMEAQCKKYSDKLKNYESHVNQLSSELWKVGEKLLMEKNEKDWLKMQLKEKNGSRQSLNSITSTISLPQTKRDVVKLNNKDMKPPSSVDTKRKLFKVPENVNTESGGLHVSDEEGELFDNRYINQLKSGNYDMEVHNKVRGYQPDRLSELQYRNSLCLPHLKSSYPAETQFQTVKEDHIKGFINLDDSITTKYSRPKKEAGQTTYKKPGPPTPSKNGGRNSMQGNELREPLKEFNENKKPTTPSRIKSLFMGNNSKSSSRDENSIGTPKGRQLSIFRKPK